MLFYFENGAEGLNEIQKYRIPCAKTVNKYKWVD